MKKELVNFARYGLTELTGGEIIGFTMLNLVFFWILNFLAHQSAILPLWICIYVILSIGIGIVALISKSMWKVCLYRAVALGGASPILAYLSYKVLLETVIGIPAMVLPFLYVGGYILSLIFIILLVRKLIRSDAYRGENKVSYPAILLVCILSAQIYPVLFSQFNVLTIMAVAALLLGFCYALVIPSFYKAYLLRKLERMDIQSEK